MAIANILVPIAGVPQDAVALETALAAAKPFAAHVSALFVLSDEHGPTGDSGWQTAPDTARQIAEAHAKVTSRLKESARETFAACVLHAGAKVAALADRSGRVTASWSEETGKVSQVIARNAHFADLVVFPAPAGVQDDRMHDAFMHTLLRTERPVLLSPQSPPERVGTKVAVGWDDGLAASHALVAALPFLELAGSVKMLCVRKEASSTLDLAEVKDYLALHGVKVSELSIVRTGRPIGEALLDAAAGCDLIVVGGYGHSRTFESIFGGVTEHITSHPRIPILMVH